jgi:2-iminoacetate synthase
MTPRSVALKTNELSSNAVDFIDDAALRQLLAAPPPDAARVRELCARSLARQSLTVAETAELLRVTDPALHEEIADAAARLKLEVYGRRIVLFAPLYVGSECINDCTYCGFRRSHRGAARVTLESAALRSQIEALEQRGHKRLILVFGESPRYDAAFIARTVQEAYGVRIGRGEIRRVNINAAPLDLEGFRTVKAAGIGTYQIFQETYDHEVYARVHPARTRKADYLWRLDGPSRAFEAGCDDLGIGALFGLGDWRFEVLALVAHACHLVDRYGVGPHTISFPRLQPAAGTETPDPRFAVSDAEFRRLIATLRLAVPYTGLICTAREGAAARREALRLGVSQIDGGSNIEMGGYTGAGCGAQPERAQFTLGDTRSLDEVIAELVEHGQTPSTCTACYRKGRTGEHFMEFAIPGFIKRFCTPNALCTFKEYLLDYATPATRTAGEALIARELAEIPDGPQRKRLVEHLGRLEAGERDLLV